jgi:anti-sigma B factor antagonist
MGNRQVASIKWFMIMGRDPTVPAIHGKCMDSPITVSNVGDFTVVEFQVASLMNSMEIGRISTALDELIADHLAVRMVLDFTRVVCLSSQAIGMITSVHKKLSQLAGGKLVLCGVGPQLMQVLKITRLDRLLKIAKDQKDAMAM